MWVPLGDTHVHKRLHDLAALRGGPVTMGWTSKALVESQKRFKETLRTLLDSVRPVIPIPATEKEILDAFGKLQSEIDKFSDILRPLRDSLFQTMNHEHVVLKATSAQYLELCKQLHEWRDENHWSRDTWDVYYKQQNLAQEVATLERDISCWDKYMDAQYCGELQLQLHKMVEGQSEEMKQRVVEITQFNKHLVHKVEKPVVKLQPKLQSHHLPLEMMTMIFSWADLESCVNLRQVNSCWFQGYQNTTIWEEKLNERNPWFKIDENHADSVLVFVARTRTWTPVFTIEDIPLPSKTAPIYCVFAEQLKQGKKLPSDFKSMIRHLPNCYSPSCDHLHLGYHDAHTKLDLLNLWTLEKTEEYPGTKVVWSDGVKTRINYQDVEIEVPFGPHQFNHTLVSCPVSIGPCTITFHATAEEAVVLPRHNPQSDAGIIYTTSLFSGSAMLQDAYLHCAAGKKLWYIADFIHKKMLPYATAHKCSPVSSYNGSIWWLLSDRASMVPTLIDLLHPRRVYYNLEKAIKGPCGLGEGFEQGSKHSGSDRFLVGTPRHRDVNVKFDYKHVFDLATGSVTYVNNTDGGPFFLGLQNDHFRPFFLAKEDAEVYKSPSV